MLTLSLLLSAFAIDTIGWNISEDYQIRFSGNGAKGTFSNLRGTIVFDKNDLSTARMDVRVDVATIDTGNRTKDKHAKSADWFDAASYPHISFKSTSFQRAENGYLVDGTLNLHGTDRQVTIPFIFDEYRSGASFIGSLTVNRNDYGLTGPWLRGQFVGNEFTIDLRVPVTQ